jgi:hypothetical protein
MIIIRWFVWSAVGAPWSFMMISRPSFSIYGSNLNDKTYADMRIEDKKQPAYLLGYAYGFI